MAEYKNPQQEPGLDRRLLLVFALTFLVIVLSQPLLKKYGLQPPSQPEKSQSPLSTTPTPAAAPATSAVSAPTTPGAVATKQASAEGETVIENDLYKITFTNRGAQVKSWILKKYDDDKQQPLELVNELGSARYGQPLSLWTYDEAQRNKLNSALYVTSSSGTLHAPAEITFEYSDQDVSVRKTLRFGHSYVVDIETSVKAKGSEVAAFVMWPGGLGDELAAAQYSASTIEYQYNDKVERLAIKKIVGGATVSGPFHWAGLTDRYFAAVFMPADPQGAALVTMRNWLDVPKDPQKPNPQDTTKIDVLGIAAGSLRGPSVTRLFVGPKSLQVLESVPVVGLPDAPDLRQLINFGFFGIIARPLFLWLKWSYGWIHNWGWAIALQTLIINLALLPLRISQMKSMLKMQRIAPQIKSIQERYKKYSMRDPKKQEMQQEIAALYKSEGVNPAGGCLPLIIQMPFLFAYYSMLGSALDLRHAHWLWIHDLSSPDPMHLLPIGIIITMFLTQRMTPQAGMDPTQQKMMAFTMPIMLGVISWNLAAGLCLYWSEGNIISIVQQAIMNRTSLGQQMREMAEKRARKNNKK